jgi:hypothetical protein
VNDLKVALKESRQLCEQETSRSNRLETLHKGAKENVDAMSKEAAEAQSALTDALKSLGIEMIPDQPLIDQIRMLITTCLAMVDELDGVRAEAAQAEQAEQAAQAALEHSRAAMEAELHADREQVRSAVHAY